MLYELKRLSAQQLWRPWGANTADGNEDRAERNEQYRCNIKAKNTPD